jgi:hypothetical protein
VLRDRDAPAQHSGSYNAIRTELRSRIEWVFDEAPPEFGGPPERERAGVTLAFQDAAPDRSQSDTIAGRGSFEGPRSARRVRRVGRR